MTRTDPEKTAKSDQIEQRLIEAGLPDYAADGVLKIDALMQGWRRRMSKRELGLHALRELGLDLDLAQLDVLVAIAAPPNEFGAPTLEETLVGTVAERLMIDPSRASRLVSEMVDMGYAQRLASQTDSRRTVLGLTDSGAAIVDAVRMLKFLILGEFLAGWSAEDVAVFLPLLARFSSWTEDALDGESHQFDTEISKLADDLAKKIHRTPAA